MQSSQYLDNLCTLDAKFCHQDVLNFEGQNPFRFENYAEDLFVSRRLITFCVQIDQIFQKVAVGLI